MFLFQMKINKTRQGSQPLISAGHKQIFTSSQDLNRSDFMIIDKWLLTVIISFLSHKCILLFHTVNVYW